MLRIEAAVEKDIPLLLAFVRELAEFEKRAHEVVATEALLRENFFGPKKCADGVIGYLNDTPVATGIYFYTFSTFLGRPSLYVEDVYVRPEFRSRGFGKQIFIHLAQVAAERGCGRMEWSVLDWNQKAIDFYERLGAQPINEWKKYRLTGPALSHLAASKS
jgi:GNAT superfamily N-acetyltransferase